MLPAWWAYTAIHTATDRTTGLATDIVNVPGVKENWNVGREDMSTIGQNTSMLP